MLKNTIDFEAKIAELEAIAKKLENKELPLEDAVELLKLGKKISKVCATALAGAEGKLELITEELGEILVEGFEV